ncbi:MAG: hypothetical protein C4523_01080 [Myxococcales bacterium]|nr:MAG: hypothetical protein C4523_01080 [Myxococcales bacterium]
MRVHPTAKRLVQSLAILAVLGVGAAAFAAGAEGIIVWKLDAKRGVTKDDVDSISGLLSSEVEHVSGVRVITEADIATILKGEEKKQRCGVDDTSCLAEIGNALGVPEAVSGDLGKVGNVWILNLRRIAVREVRVLKRASRKVSGPIDDLIDALPGAVEELFGDGAPPPVYVGPLVEASEAEKAPEKPAEAPPPDPTRFSLANYPEPFSGPRLFAYHSVALFFEFQKQEWSDGDNVYAMALTPGFSVAVVKDMASIYVLAEFDFYAGATKKTVRDDDGNTRDVELKPFLLSGVGAGFNVNVINKRPFVLTADFSFSLLNADPEAMAGVDGLVLSPKVVAGFGFFERLYFSPYLALPIGIAIDGQFDHSFAIEWGVPIGVRLVDRLHLLAETVGQFVLAPDQGTVVEFVPAVGYLSESFQVKLGVPLHLHPDAPNVDLWRLSLYLAASF